MRHVISVLLQNEVGALTRMTGLFSTRGYNIDSLNVAPTDDPKVSRVTLVVNGSDASIAQLNTQLAKLVDVVNIHDMTLGDHFESELVMIKLSIDKQNYSKLKKMVDSFSATILDNEFKSFTVQLINDSKVVENFIISIASIGHIAAVARSGSVAVSKGEVTLSSYVEQHKLTG